MKAEDATISQLAEELQRANIALAIGLSRTEERKWARYRKQVQAELVRRTAPPKGQAVTDAELMSELQDFA